MFKNILMLLLSVCITGGFAQTVNPVGTNYTTQPSSFDTVSWVSGKYTTKLNGKTVQPARGFEVKDTSSGGIFKIHPYNAFDSVGRKRWLSYKIPASSGNIQRVGIVFDEADSAGTTIPKGGLIIWY
jgi:hypothetical protein